MLITILFMFFKLPVSRKQLYIYKGLLLAVKSSGKQYVLVYVCVCVCVCVKWQIMIKQMW